MRSWVFILFLIQTITYGQEWKIANALSVNADYFVGVDSYNYSYWIKNKEVFKQSEKEFFSYSDTQLGAIYSVDITNPFSVLVFYYEAQTLVVLDNKFNEINRIRFSDFPNVSEVGQIGNAGNQNIWTINLTTQRLEILDYRHRILQATSLLLSGEVVDMVSNYNTCYVQTSDYIYQFNNYGSVLNKIEASSFTEIYPARKGVVLLNGDQWYFWERELDEPRLLSINLKKESLKNLFYTRQHLYVFDGKQLHTYIAEN